jgi:hypothetical protein
MGVAMPLPPYGLLDPMTPETAAPPKERLRRTAEHLTFAVVLGWAVVRLFVGLRHGFGDEQALALVLVLGFAFAGARSLVQRLRPGQPTRASSCANT